MLDCIMTAAGASSRMRRPVEAGTRETGGRDSFKPLLPFAGSTLAETAAAAALGAGCRLLLVVGHRGEEVAALFDAPRYRDPRLDGRIVVVRNPRWEEGLLGSIQSALPLLGGEAFFVAHADMPFVESAHYAALSAAREEWAASRVGTAASPGEGGETAFVAACEGKRGHPVLVPSAWAEGISALPPGEGLRAFLRERPATPVEIGSAALRDIDTPGDYELATRG